MKRESYIGLDNLSLLVSLLVPVSRFTVYDTLAKRKQTQADVY
jgi:hypothetical protein